MAPLIRELPVAERPRERLSRLRADALSTAELLGVVLGSGAAGRSAVDVAADLLTRYEGSLRQLSVAEPRGLEQTRGVGPARAAAVVAAMALGRRLAAEPAREGHRIRAPRDVFGRLGPLLRDRRQEEFWALYLDS